MSTDWLLFPVTQEDPTAGSASANDVFSLSSNRALNDYLADLPRRAVPWTIFKCFNEQFFLDRYGESPESWLDEMDLTYTSVIDISKMLQRIDPGDMKLIFPENLKVLQKLQSMPQDQKVVVVSY